MTMPPRLRKLALTAHVAASVGWLGAVVAFLGLAVVGLSHSDPQTVRGVYLVMEPAAWLALLPLALLSLLTGLVQSLGTPWGLFRHYWVLFKLLITIVATVVLLVYMQTFEAMARIAADPAVDLGAVRDFSPLLHSALALVLLLLATILAVFKPAGVTSHGRRTQELRRMQRRRSGGRRADQPARLDSTASPPALPPVWRHAQARLSRRRAAGI